MATQPMRQTSRITLTALAALVVAWTARAADPLPSWNDGPARKSILQFIDRTTRPGSPDFALGDNRMFRAGSPA